MSKINNSGQLRAFLLDMMEKVADGKTTVERAHVVIKGAAQVNESLYAEMKAKALAKALGQTVHQLGALPLGEEDSGK